MPSLHAKLVHAYGQGCRDRGFAAGPNDGYFFQRLPYHLAGAGRMDELAALLLDYRWLEAKLRATGPAELVADFAVLDPGHTAHREAMLVRDAVRLASHVLVDDPGQLSSQLVGRLVGFEGEGEHERLGRLLSQVRADTRQTWLCPLIPSLMAPGGPLVRTFMGHTDTVTAVAVLPEGKLALSASDDGTLMLWNLDSGSVLRTLQGHSGRVTAVAVLPEGKFALSASEDCTLKLWDLASGSVVRTFQGHSDSVRAVAVLPKGNLALSSEDRTLKLWDLGSGSVLRTLAGHSGTVTAVAVLPKGKLALSASYDRTLKLWNLDSGSALRTLVGHSDWVTAVAVLPEGKLALSASYDRTLKLWDLEAGQVIATFAGDYLMQTCAVAPDARSIMAGDRGGNIHILRLIESASVTAGA